jgi:hypothetical protein
MDDDKKKTVMLVIIGVCFLIVAIMAVGRIMGNKVEVPAFEGKKTWVLCRNEACKAEYEIPLREYFVYVQENDDPREPSAPPLPCQKCSEKSVYEAIGCAKCGLVFEMASIFAVTGDRKDYPDRCPKCRYSQREVDRGVVYKPKRR